MSSSNSTVHMYVHLIVQEVCVDRRTNLKFAQNNVYSIKNIKYKLNSKQL